MTTNEGSRRDDRVKCFVAGLSLLLLLSGFFPPCTALKGEEPPRWNDTYRFIRDVPPLPFHYDHGVLAGSYPPGHETTSVSFDDVSRYLGHICLCGAGGYRIAQIAVDRIGRHGIPLEKGDFILVSSRDHTVADVVAFVLGCTRRDDPEINQYFVDTSIDAPRREYHYFIGYPPLETAVHVVYRKHLLIGNDMMDRLWKIETAFEENPASVSDEDLELYRKTMVETVRKVLLGNTVGLFEAVPIGYADFLARLDGLKSAAR
jgi:hypothetical protein